MLFLFLLLLLLLILMLAFSLPSSLLLLSSLKFELEGLLLFTTLRTSKFSFGSLILDIISTLFLKKIKLHCYL